MREVLAELMHWWNAGEDVVVGTVVATFRSAPRPPVRPCWSVRTAAPSARSRVAASRARARADGGRERRLGAAALRRLEYDALAVGLTWGGNLDVFVGKVSRETFPELGEVAAHVAAKRPVAVAKVVEHPVPTHVGRRLIVRPDGVAGSLRSARADDAVRDDTVGLLAAGHSATLSYGPPGERRGEGMRVFVSAQGAFLGYRVRVCDARPVFATGSRFPRGDDVVVDWPTATSPPRSAPGASTLARCCAS